MGLGELAVTVHDRYRPQYMYMVSATVWRPTLVQHSPLHGSQLIAKALTKEKHEILVRLSQFDLLILSPRDSK